LSTYFADNPQTIRLSVSSVIHQYENAGRILLMRRSDNRRWGLPGGYVEPGESVSHAIEREVREETGFKVEVRELIGVYSDPKTQVIAYPSGDRVQAVNLCFRGTALEHGEPTTPEETLEIGFFDIGIMPEPFVPIHVVRISDAIAANPSVMVR
jgi:ADP-ribose pyrophosphatase YjhB (NUDIX family)